MNNKFRNSRDNKVLFIISVLVLIYWLIGKTVNVNFFIITGAIFELLWLPTLILLFALPFYSLFAFWKDRFNLRSLALYSALLLTVTIVLLISLG